MIINGEERSLTKLKIPKGIKVSAILEEKINSKDYEFCLELVYRYKLKGYTVTNATLKRTWAISPYEIEHLNYLEVTNPFFKCAKPMKLYLIDEIREKLGVEKNQLVRFKYYNC